MSSQGQENETTVVKNFYVSFYRDSGTFKKYLHPDVELTWHSSTGDRTMNFSQISELTREITGSYESFRTKIHSIIQQDERVAVHFTYHAKTIEDPEQEMALAHFMAFWELKDDKLFRGYQISQLADEADEF